MGEILEQITLNNGIKVALEHIPYVGSVSLGIWIKFGSRHEPKGYKGIAHFIEHMLFKGTSTRSAKAIADEMDLIGGDLNAYTTKECTCYYARTLSSHIPKAMDILSDMLFNSLFDEEELEKEKSVILEEISMYEDSPEDLIYDIMEASLWPDHPLGHPIAGYSEDIDPITRDKVVECFNKHYIPQNAVISIAGNFDKKEIIKQINNFFGCWKSKQNNDTSILIPTYVPNITVKNKEIEQAHLTLSFPGISLKDKDIYAGNILNTVLGGSMSSRLFQKVREEYGLVYSIYSTLSTFTDTGIFVIYAGLGPEHITEVFNLITMEIKGLLKNPISEEILYNTKEQLKSNYILGLESTSARMSFNGRNLLFLDKLESQDKMIEELESVTLNQVKSLGQSIFNLDNMGLSIVGDRKQIDEKGLRYCVANNLENYAN